MKKLALLSVLFVSMLFISCEKEDLTSYEDGIEFEEQATGREESINSGGNSGGDKDVSME